LIESLTNDRILVQIFTQYSVNFWLICKAILGDNPEYLTDSDIVVVLKTVIIEISVNQKEAIS